MAKPKMKSDEMQLLKAVSMKLDDDTAMIVTLQYHIEENPETGKNDRSKSIYRWLARIAKIEDLKTEVKDYMQDDKRLTPWFWPNDPTWNGKIVTDTAEGSSCYQAARWMNVKLKKLVAWDIGQRILNGGNVHDDTINIKAKYDVDGYVAPNGELVSLTDKAALLKHVGESLVKVQVNKTTASKNVAAVAAA